ncbi:MAG TPA: restriction endonuclease [Chloroflexus aurantiacus]|jgi:SAM-dependent methyltransferase|uniref:Modification methylase NspV n=1 Tax=Chloroflexus aurantiacus (strain ATCC 29366 / DSM 635 / J-10-fl) TaxID=324602 RepID=A9WKF9_CHLAA|nr:MULTISPECIES: class I SAM-dependent methyltransferase [Chloroflexus]ABY36037.1 modification methylase NspV [Chloroflexus aurantiacus J-10-fl]RMG50766.1 MAG: SAM-dependent DNA methyltransferase [Chloroflexota bacterium]GIV91435.1 MAG: restriction endonuclease NspV [Chloroflexus sp.]HBW67286.1 restriction endonuclease [Chloroflexus aurantiacus]
MNRQLRNVEFGDFQTPVSLARDICALIARTGFQPAAILEPTCGTGAFLQAALETFPGVTRILGFDINPQHITQARHTITPINPHSPASVEICQADFFRTDWTNIVAALPEPLLVIGNPPWVTNTALSTLSSTNLPVKSNRDHLRGIDALTGSSNFDISEWIMREIISWFRDKTGLLAMLCKTTVARKVLKYAWHNGIHSGTASLYLIDAHTHFGAAVDACLLLVPITPTGTDKVCQVFHSLDAVQPASTFGLREGILVADTALPPHWQELGGNSLKVWRSGIKHDCSNVFELHVEGDRLVNGLGTQVDIEPEVLFPLLKSADLAARRRPQRWILVPQRAANDDPNHLKTHAPKAWHYLTAHAHLLNKRKSQIYKNRPRFSIFDVGSYSFAPWKVAISGLYKKLEFVQVPPYADRPVMLDDTCYFFSCYSAEACNLLYELVTSEPAKAFWSSRIFWDAKRPITAHLLNALDLRRLARLLGKEAAVDQLLAERQIAESTQGANQYLLFQNGFAEEETEVPGREER